MEAQTWWNKNVEERLEEFKGWVGDESAPSKKYMAKYLKEVKGVDGAYHTLLDAGCGNATFYETLHQHRVNIHYTGVDSCRYFVVSNTDRGVPMIDADIRSIPSEDKTYDIVFSRHTFEHQPNVEVILNELLRIAKREMCHIFFLKPDNVSHTNWDQVTNLYHNTYSREEIEEHLTKHARVSTWKWVDLNEQECALHVYLLY